MVSAPTSSTSFKFPATGDNAGRSIAGELLVYFRVILQLRRHQYYLLLFNYLPNPTCIYFIQAKSLIYTPNQSKCHPKQPPHTTSTASPSPNNTPHPQTTKPSPSSPPRTPTRAPAASTTVKGAVGMGMDYERKKAHRFAEVEGYKVAVLQFQIRREDLERFEEIAERCPPPHDPRVLFTKTMEERGKLDPPVRDCARWMNEVLEVARGSVGFWLGNLLSTYMLRSSMVQYL
ncbi:hypothetical protein VTN00DRAFT_4878 [Thermoascus crustaceus]|uniref:uncharacterized protein n=1 Tax=Thermoascus crustaceus TaxID=5088 RepID=UPI00374205B1